MALAKLKTETDREEVLRAVADTTQTFKAIADKYGVTRERIRQIAERSGITGAERIAKKNVTREFELKKGLYPEHVAAVWKEAVRRGYDVKGFIDHRRLRKNILFINRRMVVVYHTKVAHQTSKRGPYYGHASLRYRATHLIVIDDPRSGDRTFYILPREFPRFGHLPRRSARPAKAWQIFIPLDAARARGKFEQYKEAWDLLEDNVATWAEVNAAAKEVQRAFKKERSEK